MIVAIIKSIVGSGYQPKNDKNKKGLEKTPVVKKGTKP